MADVIGPTGEVQKHFACGIELIAELAAVPQIFIRHGHHRFSIFLHDRTSGQGKATVRSCVQLTFA